MSTPIIMSTPVGNVAITVQAGRLCGIDFLSETPADETVPEDPQERRVLAQLAAYFRDGRIRFCLPLSLRGTDFQNRVWRLLGQIEPGQVRSYGAIARQLHSSPRAVGNACRQNPMPIVVPCHRVVSARGIGGYGGEVQGSKLQVKRWLLCHEGVSL